MAQKICQVLVTINHIGLDAEN